MEDASDGSSDDRTGQPAGKKQHAAIIEGDCVWEWWEKIGLEQGRFSHRKGPTDYCNIVFLDGHVIALPKKLEDDSDKTDWNGHNNLDEVFRTMGNGSY